MDDARSLGMRVTRRMPVYAIPDAPTEMRHSVIGSMAMSIRYLLLHVPTRVQFASLCLDGLKTALLQEGKPSSDALLALRMLEILVANSDTHMCVLLLAYAVAGYFCMPGRHNTVADSILSEAKTPEDKEKTKELLHYLLALAATSAQTNIALALVERSDHAVTAGYSARHVIKHRPVTVESILHYAATVYNDFPRTPYPPPEHITPSVLYPDPEEYPRHGVDANCQRVDRFREYELQQLEPAGAAVGTGPPDEVPMDANTQAFTAAYEEFFL